MVVSWVRRLPHSEAPDWGNPLGVILHLKAFKSSSGGSDAIASAYESSPGGSLRNYNSSLLSETLPGASPGITTHIWLSETPPSGSLRNYDSSLASETPPGGSLRNYNSSLAYRNSPWWQPQVLTYILRRMLGHACATYEVPPHSQWICLSSRARWSLKLQPRRLKSLEI